MVARKKQADAAQAAGVQEQAVTPTVKRTVQRLSFKERTLLVQAMEARRDELVRYGPHLEDVAAEMSRLLGFEVTKQHVRTGMDDSGVGWYPVRFAGTWPLSRLGRIREDVVATARGLCMCERDDVPEADLADLEATGRAFCEIVQRIKDRFIEDDEEDEAA